MKNPDCFIYSLEDLGDYLPIPRLLLNHPLYRKLSSEAKILYSVLYEKLGECKLKNWYDEENRAYVIYPDYEMQALLCVTPEKLMATYEELDCVSGIGLLERVPQPLEKPTRIYLKQFHKIHQGNVEITCKEPPSTEEYYAKLKEYEERKQGNIILFPVIGGGQYE